MIKKPHSFLRQGLAAATDLTLVQHNSLGSWDVFLDLFSSLAEGPPADIFSFRTPSPPRDFSPLFQALNLLLHPSLGPEWPATYRSSFCKNLQYYQSFPQKQMTLWR